MNWRTVTVETYNVGKIVNTHGIKGEVRVLSTTDFPEERFKIGSKLYLYQENQKPQLLIVASQRQHKNFYLLSFEGYPTIESVEAFKGATLKIREDQLTELPENEYYVHEIVGLDVFDDTGRELGKVKEVLSPGANDVWVIGRANQKDLLLPYIEEVVLQVDLEAGKVIVHLLEGLEEL